MTQTPNLKITHIETSQAQKETTANAAFTRIDGALGTSVTVNMIANSNLDLSTGSYPGENEMLSALRVNLTSSPTLTSDKTITFPTNSKLYLIANNTTGGRNLLLKPGSGGTPVTLGPGEERLYYCNGTTFVPLSLVNASTSSVSPYFGDGADGDVTISTSATALTRDMMYNNLTITATGTLPTAQFRVYVKGLLSIATGGVLHCDGNAGAAGGTAGAALAAGSCGPATAAGGAGGTAAGSAGGSQTVSGIGTPGGSTSVNAGGPGGNGASGSGANGGSTTPMTAVSGNPWELRLAILGSASAIPIRTGSGGGGGGGDGTAGGGGGGAGGYLIVMAYVVFNNGAIRAHGGAGGSPAAGNRGGGGGGQGGIVVLVYHVYSGSGTITATGGVGGTKTGTGTNGTNGNAGVVRQYVV